MVFSIFSIIHGRVIPILVNCFYNRGWFIIDLVAAIPFDLLLFGSDTDEVAINIKFTITKTRNMDFGLLDSLTYNHPSNILFLNLILSFLRVTRR